MTAPKFPLPPNLNGDLGQRLAALSDKGNHKAMLQILSVAAAGEAKRLVPRKTGNLARSIRVGDVTPDHGEVWAGGRNGVGYAQAVEFGTAPHVIRPKTKKALAFPNTGMVRSGLLKVRKTGTLTTASARKYGRSAMTIVRSVKHPGTKAKPYLIPGAKKALEQGGLKQAVIRVWNNAA
jgi:hypothetical protein